MMSTSTSLLQDVLRPHALGVEKLNSKLAAASLRSSSPTTLSNLEDSDDELVGVTSIPGSPSRSQAPSRPQSRASSPTRSGASKRRVPGPLHISKGSAKDPLRVFPTEVSQRIFGMLDIKDLACCSRVCKKWEKSQSLNYVWFQHHRKDSFHDESLPPGKWTRRESKLNWRQTFMKTISQRDKDLAGTVYVPPSRVSRPNSPYIDSFSSGFNGSSSPRSDSGYVTPREAREEQWRQEAVEKAKPGKVEMRGMYKELGGRKAKAKNKFGAGNQGVRDKGGWDDGHGLE